MFREYSANNNRPGRPVSINKNTITRKCLDFYILNGIDNQSFNNVIKHAGVSKGPVYRLYGSEDSLQRTVLKEYYEIFVKDRLLEFKKSKSTLKDIIMDITSGLISNRYKACLYHRSRMEKYKLGKLTRDFITKIDKEIYLAYEEVVKKELVMRKKEFNTINVEDIVNMVVNGITTINLLKLNKNQHKIILSYSNMLIKMIKSI